MADTKHNNYKKAYKTRIAKKDSNKINHRKIANKMMKESQKNLIPTMNNKLKEIINKIRELKIDSDSGLVSTQIELILSNRNIYDIASSSAIKEYTSEELMIGFEMYRNVIAEINKKFSYPPSVFTFCGFMNISTTTYKNYKSNPDKNEVIQMIDDYIAGIQLTSAQLGKLKEITTIFGLKSLHGFYEAQAPVHVKKEIKVDLDEIDRQIKALNKGKPIDVEYEEK